MKRFWMMMACALTLAGCTDYKAYYNGVLEEISSERYNGRSVYHDGDVRAAKYLIDQLASIEGIVPCEAAGPEDASVQPYAVGMPWKARRNISPTSSTSSSR